MSFKQADLIGPVGMGLFMILVQIIALVLVPPLVAYDLQAFDNPESVLNPLIYIVLILLFTGALLLIIKFKVGILIQIFVAFAVFSTLVYVIFGLVILAWPSGLIPAIIIAVAGSAALTGLLIVYPEWFIIDSVGVLIAAGAGSLFGVSLAIIPAVLLLIILAVYDFISVYKTKHMLTLAEGVMDMKLPILFVLPRKMGYSFAKSKVKKVGEGEREAFFMGLGDAVMPTILVVSANTFLKAQGILGINFPSLGAMLGTMIGYAALMILVLKGKPQAGLPFLCTGAIAGFLLGCLVAGINPFF